MSEVVPESTIQRLRQVITSLLTTNGHPPPALPRDNVAHLTQLQGGLLHSWSEWANDPAHTAASWLWQGAPAGISVDFRLEGLLEPVGPELALDVQELATDHESFHNYAGVETDPEAMAIIDSHVALGRLKEFGSHEAQSRFVDGHPVPNKFACITKLKPDGSVKRRIIMDSKKSRVTDASRKTYRQVLPRQTE